MFARFEKSFAIYLVPAKCHDDRTMRKLLYLIIPILIYSCDNGQKKMTAEEYLETGKFIWKTMFQNPGKQKQFKANS
jgi:hypothetical protein